MVGRKTHSQSARKPTLRDVGRLAKVDPSLVSRVMNNDSKAYATAETRKRIFEAIKSLDYKPNTSARGLKLARTSMLGLLLPDLTNPMNESVVNGIQEKAFDLGYGILIGNHAEIGVDTSFVSLLLQGRVDGLLTLGHAMTDNSLKALTETNDGRLLPVNGRIPGITSSVTVNDSLGSELCVAHLVSLGHKRIVGIFAPLKFDTAKRRLSGFKKACRRNGVEAIVVEARGYTYQQGYESANIAIAKFNPTAIFASSLGIAIGTLAALREQNLEVPEQVSVIAFHDAEIANFTSPPLTTVSLPAMEMGMESVEQLVKMISGGKPKHHIVAGEPVLILRRSTAPAAR